MSASSNYQDHAAWIKRFLSSNRDQILFILNKLWLPLSISNIAYLLFVYLLPLIGLLSSPLIPLKMFIELTLCVATVVLSSLWMFSRFTTDRIELRIDDFVSIISFGKTKIATCCLELVSAPGSVYLDSNSTPKYNTAILLAIREGLSKGCTISYEVGVEDLHPYLRIFISSMHDDLASLRNTLQKEATRIEAIFLASLGNVELELLKNDHLEHAINPLFNASPSTLLNGPSRDLPLQTCVLSLQGNPTVLPKEFSSQIGTFLSTAIHQKKSVKLICTFSKARPGRERKALEGQWRRIRAREKQKEDTLADQTAKKRLIQTFDELQNNSGWFDASISLLTRITNSSEKELVINGIKGLVLSIWGGNGQLRVRTLNISKRAIIRLVGRRHLHRNRMPASRLAAFVNTPVQKIPVISPHDVPEFIVPPAKVLDNEIFLGHVVYKGQKLNRVGLKLEWLREHAAILGATGTGKTTAVKRIMAEISRTTSIPWWIFDVKGSEYVDLVQCADSNIVVIKPGMDPEFAIDILDSDMDDPIQSANSTFQLFRELFREHGASSELTPAMERLFRESLIELASSDDHSIDRLIGIIRSRSLNEFGEMTRDALLNRLQILIRNPLGVIFNTGRTTRISSLLDRRVIFDLRHVARTGGMDSARLLYNLVAKRIFDAAMRRGIRTGLQHIVVLEEASNLVPESYTRTTAADVTTGESMVLLQRATGQGVIVISTRPNISSNILANTATKVIFRLPYDSSVGARFMSLNDAQERYLRTLKRGHAIVTLPLTEAFEIVTDPFDYPAVSSGSVSCDSTASMPPHIELSDKQSHDTASRADSTEPLAKVFDRIHEFSNQLIAWLASHKLATEKQLIDILQAMNNELELSDAEEIISELVSKGTIERESIPLVDGGVIYTLPGNGSTAVKQVILTFIQEHLPENACLPIEHATIDLIIYDTAIMIIPEHPTSSQISTTIDKIKSTMINLGEDVHRLIVIIRGSVAAAKIREALLNIDESDAVTVVSAFPSSLEKLIDGLSKLSNLEPASSCESDAMAHVPTEDLIESVRETGSASRREIQMRLWTSLLQEFVDSSGGASEWQHILDFIETTSAQSMKGRTTPLKVEDGQRALRELLADDVLVAVRLGSNFSTPNLKPGLWIVNNAILEELRLTLIQHIIDEWASHDPSVNRNHGFYDICEHKTSIIIFPTREQLQAILDVNDSVYCKKCHTTEAICILPASEYVPKDCNIPSSCTIVTLDSEFHSILATL